MVHTPIQFLRPEISADRFDFDVRAISTRRTIIDRIADGTTLVQGHISRLRLEGMSSISRRQHLLLPAP